MRYIASATLHEGSRKKVHTRSINQYVRVFSFYLIFRELQVSPLLVFTQINKLPS